MIGISALDSLSTWELIKITWGNTFIRITDRPTQQLSVEPLEEPQIIQFKEMNQDKIITLCKMEVEHRFGMNYVREKIEESEK